ncbi:MAG TPA: imidazoleglycerol-phosphate dehydratase, partial [Candidatus Avoscillospira avistercoris]|nr:imidazoleglycerol-phosphate dehydratase [Candidatus Avoscillospira avistercoris]
MRQASLTRKTGETDITLALNLDGVGDSRLQLGVGFLEHM